jgi:hypothetical protein
MRVTLSIERPFAMTPSTSLPVTRPSWRPRFTLCVLALVLALTACGGGSDMAAAVTDTTSTKAATLVLAGTEAVGLHCASGGAYINAGLDSNANGVLDTSEITSTQYVCNGSLGAAGTTGSTGSSGLTSLVRTSAEAAGSHCTFGGSQISVGLDSNSNGVLDSSEITSTDYVCQGVAGATGTTGTTGSTGATGTTGLSSLIAVASEAAGANCTYGGHKVTTGLDSNSSGVLDTAEITSTTYTCDGAPGPGVTWVQVTGTSQQALPNTGYIANNAAQVAITLPTAPAVGDLVEVSGAGAGGWLLAQNAGQTVMTKALPNSYPNAYANWTARENVRSWRSVASSADGSKLVAVVRNGQIYTSTDAGATWTARDISRVWVAVASSADGSKLVAVTQNDQIYTSTDAGVTWAVRASSRNWSSVASSADGSKLVAVEYVGQIHTSTDSGVNWTVRDDNRNWSSVASSADGSKLVAGVDGGLIYTSTDTGVTWTPRDSSRSWTSVASSADGNNLVAGAFGGQIFTSTDSGLSWTPRDSSRQWWSVASSSDGIKLVAVVIQGQIFTSTDSGVSWTPRDSSRYWWSVASSSDGNQLVAAATADQIYTTSTNGTTPGTTGTLSGSQYDSLKLQYLGSGVFMPLDYTSYSGSFVVQ